MGRAPEDQGRADFTVRWPVFRGPLQGPQGSLAWASDNANLSAPGRTWDLAAAGVRIVRGTLPVLPAERVLNAPDLMLPTRPGLVKVEISDQLDGSLDGFARRF